MMKETVKIGYVGLGCRGKGMLKKCFAQMADVEIAWLCDVYAPYTCFSLSTVVVSPPITSS